MEHLKKSSEITIRGTQYLYDLSADTESLSLSFEEKSTTKLWKGDFTCSYIETLTQKSKSFKKFPIFLKMLISALENTSESVIIDLLTYQELEMFRSSRNPGSNSSSSSSSNPNPKLLSKRFLILTFTGEFERVHYPLPLTFEDAPDVETMKKTISRLRSELEKAKTLQGLNFDPESLLKENEELKQLVKKYEHNQTLAAVPRKGAVEIDNLIKESKLLEQENEKLQLEGTREVKKLRKENNELQNELDRVKKEMDLIIVQLEREAGGKVQMDDINGKVLLLTQQLEKAQRQEAKMKKDIESNHEELDLLRQNEKKLKQRVSQLEEELSAALKARGNIRNSSPAARSNQRAPVTNNFSRSPNTRSPKISTRLGTPPGSREGSSNLSRPGSDRIGVRYSPSQKTRASPNRGNSPSSTSSRKSAYANNSPVSRLKTPPSKPSPIRKNSPQQSPGNRKKENVEVKKTTGMSEVDAKFKKLTELLKATRN
ncbi:hypothetical protein SteCoe_2286 [Stentor coeruleus]|uniref:Uncharacterized protein n=1 Tax=Stentor coeruleus TaxID=5963 RepID=A0A1R2CZT8_9CILI|nr:hypothetical protein SteCoe_2286 [Stentor coeruleus]